MDWKKHIESNSKVMGGKPVIKGTRITVEHVLERLGEGWSIDQLLESYPHLTAEQIRAALSYASHALSNDETIFLSESA